MLSHVMCDLGRAENDTEKSPNIIEDYETANIFFTAEYIFIREKVIENEVSELLTAKNYENSKEKEEIKGIIQKPI